MEDVTPNVEADWATSFHSGRESSMSRRRESLDGLGGWGIVVVIVVASCLVVSSWKGVVGVAAVALRNVVCEAVCGGASARMSSSRNSISGVIGDHSGGM
jgi:hypothetical protein